MPLIKTQGIVMKHINLGEADKIITLFTDKLGKVQVVAHGARKPRSKLMSSAQVFCYGEYVLYKGKSLYTIDQSEIIESFQGLTEDLYALTYVSYMIELVDVLTMNDEENVELFGLLLKSMYLMEDDTIDKELLTRIFELKSMAISGYMPELSMCGSCGSGNIKDNVFSVRLGGLLCPNCRNKDVYGVKLDASTLSVMKYFLKNSIEKIRTVKAAQQNKNELKKLLKSYIGFYLEKEFKSLDFLNDIKNVDNL